MRLVFDLDGTLIESDASLAAAANTLLGELGREPLSVETIRGFVGHGAAKLVERAIAASGGAEGLNPKACLERFRAIYSADPVSGATVFGHVHETLAGFARAGHGLAVCTQKPDLPTGKVLRGLRLMPPISVFTGGDSLDVLKPDPRMFHHAASQLPPGPAVMIGDSETDAATAHAAGVPFVFFTRGYARVAASDLAPFATFDDYRNLPGIIAQLEQAAPKAAQ